MLIVKADGKELLRKLIGKNTTENGWTEFAVDLTAYAGRSVKLELINQANGWSFEAGHWAQIAMVSN